MNQRIRVRPYIIDADLRQIDDVREEFLNYLKKLETSIDLKMGWKLVFTELLSNAIVHACKEDKKKKITISWDFDGKNIHLEVTDPGGGPYAERIESPSLPKDPYAVSGRGIYIISTFADKWYHSKGLVNYTQVIVKAFASC